METKAGCRVLFESIDDKVEKQGERLNKLEDRNTELTKLATLLEMQIESNKDQDQILKLQSETLVKIDQNLTTMNKSIITLDNKVEALEDDFHARLKANSISVGEVFKKTVYVIVALLLGAIFTLITKG